VRAASVTAVMIAMPMANPSRPLASSSGSGAHRNATIVIAATTAIGRVSPRAR
jgi:hypothetical protein